MIFRETGLILISSLLLSILAQVLSGREMRRGVTRRGEVRSDGRLIEGINMIIITLSSVLVQVSLIHAPMFVMISGGAFGAFLAAACWSDAQTGWVPDFAILPALVFGTLCSWWWHFGSMPDPMTALLLALGCLGLFAILILCFVALPFVRTTPPDAVFALLIVAIPADIPQMLTVLAALVACLILVMTRPQWVRALIPAEERERLTSQMEEAMDYDAGHMNGRWYPLGPLAMICILVGVCANTLM